jgi:capsular exopolysaccharide synthesis family protein
MKIRKRNQQLGSYIPISSQDPHSVITEQYRKLRTNIELSHFDQDIKTIALTSTMAMEGKTVTSINLATVYAQSGLKTLLIDMDLRKPKIHRGFRVINQIGLSDMITHKLSIEETVHIVDDHLHILTSGTKLPYPAEFLMSEPLKALITELKNHYDRIIIDTPPMTAVTDATIISSFVDGVILVFASREARTDVAERVINDLKTNNAKIIGSVLTRVQKREHSYLNYTYYHYKDSTSRKTGE